jgi:hypothetical protein
MQNQNTTKKRYPLNRYAEDRRKEMGRAAYKIWRFSIFKRDDFKCVICGSNEKLQAHHILPWRSHHELRHDVNNGVTLCRKHHKTMTFSEHLFVERFTKWVAERDPVVLTANELALFELVPVVCVNCGRPFDRIRSTALNKKRIYCDRKCQREHEKALPYHRDEHGRKINPYPPPNRKTPPKKYDQWARPSKKRWHAKHEAEKRAKRLLTAPLTGYRWLLWSLITPPEDGSCMLWPFNKSTNKSGQSYGTVSVGSRYMSFAVTRLVYEMFNDGPIPDGYEAAHSCGNTLCFRPDHLILKNRSEQVRGSYRKGTRKSPFAGICGEKVTGAKLTNEQVVEIRRRWDAGERGRDMAPDYPMIKTLTLFWNVGTRRTWKHVPEAEPAKPETKRSFLQLLLFGE